MTTKTVKKRASDYWRVFSSYYFRAPIEYDIYELVIFRILTVYATWESLATLCPVSHPYPNGIAKLVDISFICPKANHDVFRFIYLIFGVLYVFKIYMPLASFVLALFHTLDATAKNSDGSIGHSNQMISLLLITQFITYSYFSVRSYLERKRLPIKHKDDDIEEVKPIVSENSTTQRSALGRLFHLFLKPYERRESLVEDCYVVYYSHQVMAIVYVISAISKAYLGMMKSNEAWFNNINIALHVVKANEEKYYSGHSAGFEHNRLATALVEGISNYPVIGALFFGGAFFIELLAILFIFNRVALLIGGILIWAMHTGILLTMQLSFYHYKFMLVTYFMNFPYWVCTAYNQIKLYRYSKGIKISELLSTICGKRLDPQQSTAYSTLIKMIPILLLTIVCLRVQDQYYPLSHFPMYATPAPFTFYFYISDANNNPVFHYPNFKCQSSQIKKYFVTARRAAQENQQQPRDQIIELAGNQTLDYFYNAAPLNNRKKLSKLTYPLKLHYVKLSFNSERQILKEESVVGYFQPPEQASQNDQDGHNVASNSASK